MRIINAGHLKLTGLLILIVITMLGHRCGDVKDYVDQTPTPGNGKGDYYINYASIPDVFYCAGGSMKVWITPMIDSSYKGFNRVFFTLDGPQGFYRSNYVDFNSYNTNTQTVEFGGAISTDTYSVIAYMANIQEDCTNDSNIYERAATLPKDVEVFAGAPPQKTMTIEYGYQTSDTTVPSYDLFQSPHLAEFINVAFNPGHTTYTLVNGLTGLNAELVPAARDYLAAYVRSKKMYINKMYLCGVKGFKDGSGNLMPYVLGATLVDTSSFLPNDHSGSLVAFETCMIQADSSLGADYNDYINKTTIHELGHQRAIWLHSGHLTQFCVMNSGMRSQYGSIIVGRSWNPMFCWSCLDSLRNVSW